MHRLASYISAMTQPHSALRMVCQCSEQETWVDQGFAVKRKRTVFDFDNGVVICLEVEQDQFPADLACAECWIRYQVLALGTQPEVLPRDKSFSNACRTSFWLKFQLAADV
jgi:hypothetical protein